MFGNLKESTIQLKTGEIDYAVVGKWIALAGNGNFGSIVSDMLSVMYSANYIKRCGWMFPILAKFAKPKNAARFIRLAKACLTCDTYDRLEKITCPTFILERIRL